MDANGVWYGLMNPPKMEPPPPPSPRILVIGAGSRGNAYARALSQSSEAQVYAVAEPIAFKRNQFGRRYIWQESEPSKGQCFEDWKDFLAYEEDRCKRVAEGAEDVEDGVDAVFVCTLDEQHTEIVTALATLNMHILCEKPLATTLDDCLSIYSSLLPEGVDKAPKALFGIGHVLRYSPHNMLLRDLLLNQRIIGDTLSIEHTEPVGWWHFSHSYVRGNWRKESTTAPSLLTKSCHDIDLLLWLLSSPTSATSHETSHLPTHITSTGHLSYFRQNRKPPEAGTATNCLACPHESNCMFSAKKIYIDRHLRQGRTDWPVKIVNPEIEDCYRSQGINAAEKLLIANLAEDYTRSDTPQAEIDARPWFGRCVWESDNDVCDDQIVTMTWEDDLQPQSTSTSTTATNSNTAQQPSFNRYSKTATFHMISQTEAQCERRGRIYGTKGEITYDSKTIRVYDFATGEAKLHHPPQPGGGHGGGDAGLASQFVRAVKAVKEGSMGVDEAQRRFIGCTLEDVVRSHAMVFAAEEARRERKVVEWKEWWAREVEGRNGNGNGWVEV